MGSSGCKWQQRKRKKTTTSQQQQWFSGPRELIIGLVQPSEEPVQKGLRVLLSGSHRYLSANTAPRRLHGHSRCWFLTLHHQSWMQITLFGPESRVPGKGSLLGSAWVRSWVLKHSLSPEGGPLWSVTSGEKKLLLCTHKWRDAYCTSLENITIFTWFTILICSNFLSTHEQGSILNLLYKSLQVI